MKRNFAIIILFISAGFVLYSNSTGIGPREDDKGGYVVRNAELKKFRNFPKLFTRSYFDISREKSYRPTSTAIYMFNYLIFGDLWSGWHISSILMHIANAILIYFVLGLIFSDKQISIIGGFIFLFHPAISEAVIVPSYNEDLLVGLFLLLSFTFYLLAGKDRPKSLFKYFLSCLFYFLAVLSKESALVYVLIPPAYDFVELLSKKRIKEFFNPRNLGYYLGFFLVPAAYLIIHYFWLGKLRVATLSYIGGSLYANLLTMSKVFLTYIRLLFLPVNLSLGYHFELVESFWNPGMILRFTFILTLVVFLIYLIRSNKEVFFLSFWTLLFLMPALNLVPILHFNLLAERYLYVPAIGFSGILGFLIFRASLIIKLRYAWHFLLIGILISYSVVLELRISEWKDEFRLYYDAVQHAPQNIYHRWNLATMYLEKKDYARALPELIAVEGLRERGLNFRYPDVAIKIAGCYHVLGETKKAIGKLLELFRKYPKNYLVNYNLGLLLESENRHFDAAMFFKRSYLLSPSNVNSVAGFIRNYEALTEEEKKRIEVPEGMNEFLKGEADADGAQGRYF